MSRSSTHGMGHVRDVPDKRDYPLDRLLGSKPMAGQLPPSVSLRRYVDRVRDQSITNSCVGQAFARAIHMRAAIAGKPITYPSALGIYSLARSFGSKETILLDHGCMPRDAADGLRKWGVCAETRWPFDEGKVNDVLPWDVLEAGADATVSGYYRVPDVDGVCQALAAGYPVAFAMDVDDNYERLSGPGVYQPGGRGLGGHMQTIIGYDENTLEVVNSWGTLWGNGGFARIPKTFAASDACTDFYALTVAPEVTR